MTTNKRSRKFPLSLTWAACLCCVHVGCDETSEPLAGEIDHDGELLHADEVEARDTRESVRVAAPEHDDGCGQRSPVTVEWVVGAGGLPEVAVDLDDAHEPGARSELQFHVVALPVGAAGTRPAGAPVVLRGDARVRMPDALVAAVRSGEPHVAFAIFSACTAEQAGGECLVRGSGELHIEDGRAFLAADYQVHLREKWGASKPWLFEDGVVSAIVDMKGL